MIQMSKFLAGCLGVMLILAACSAAEMNETAESADNGKIGEESSSTVAQPALTSPPLTSIPDTPVPTASAEIPALVKADLPDLGQAPEFGNKVWLNTEEPLTLASQKGKVVLLEFWTFG